MLDAQEPSQQAPTVLSGQAPAEEKRFSTGVFRAALKKRGLTDMLELHLRDFPPSDSVEKLLMARQIKTAEFADPSRAPAERRAAISEANAILERLIDQYPEDSRRTEWQFALAHSLLYDEAEPYSSSILYRGGSADDRAALSDLARRAVEIADALGAALDVEYERVDQLAIPQFEALERTGYIDKLDRLAPKAQYLRLWSLFYDALWRAPDDAVRIHDLSQILDIFERNGQLLQTPHDVGHVQVQCLLLAGMASRQVQNYSKARDFLGRAVFVADRVTTSEQRARIEWAAALARIERIRCDRDDDHYREALEGLEQFRRWVAASGRPVFDLSLTAALLERSIFRAAAEAAEAADRPVDVKTYRHKAWTALAELVRSRPEQGDRIYAAVNALIPRGADAASLDPFEQSALLAGLLLEGDGRGSPDSVLLDGAIAVGERFLADTAADAEALLPEVLYNLGVAYYRRGSLEPAARRFLRVATDHPAFPRAGGAAEAAVRIAAGLYADDSSPQRPQWQGLYRDALETLLAVQPDSDAAAYWGFYYGQLLDEMGDFEAAARQFARVGPGHEHYLESAFLRVRALARRLEREAEEGLPDPVALRRQADELFEVERQFFVLASQEIPQTKDPSRADRLRELLARARLHVAEVQVLPVIGRAESALETLSRIDGSFAGSKALAGRVWRVRLLGYEKLGRLDDAAEAIPQYVRADPDNAGATLQPLYRSVSRDVQSLRAKGDLEAARRKAEVALILAEQLYDWAKRYPEVATDADRRMLLAQCGEAHIHAGRYEKAVELLAGLLPEATAKLGGGADARILYSHAEALYHLARYDEALPIFNRLALALVPADPVRWRSLLRDLQCRTMLEQPPADVIKVIDQQRFLDPELGGAEISAEFDKLYRQNLRRLGAGPSDSPGARSPTP
jgi:tetratricopeptide (TPR) repeat protein